MPLAVRRSVAANRTDNSSVDIDRKIAPTRQAGFDTAVVLNSHALRTQTLDHLCFVGPPDEDVDVAWRVRDGIAVLDEDELNVTRRTCGFQGLHCPMEPLDSCPLGLPL